MKIFNSCADVTYRIFSWGLRRR